MSVKLDTNSLKVIGMFEGRTGAKVKDCYIWEDEIDLVVKPGEMGLAIGKGGSNIKALQGEMGKGLRIYEYSDDAKSFINSLISPVKATGIEIKDINNKKQAIITLPFEDKPRIIGKKGKNIHRIKALLERHHHISDVRIK